MNTAITRWTPETDFVRNRLDRVFNQMLQDVWGNQLATEGVAGRTWTPAVDIKETEGALHFSLELPGLTKEDIEITLENSILTIAGERKFEKETKGEEYHRLERAYGTFSRSFTLPASIGTDKVDAKFENGVLQILLPKQEGAKPRKIAIK